MDQEILSLTIIRFNTILTVLLIPWSGVLMHMAAMAFQILFTHIMFLLNILIYVLSAEGYWQTQKLQIVAQFTHFVLHSKSKSIVKQVSRVTVS